MQCTELKNNNERCNSMSLQGKDKCFFHSHDTQDERRAATTAGGKSNKNVNNPSDFSVKTACAKDLLSILQHTIDDLKTQKVSPNYANSIGYLVNIALKVLEQSDIEKRMEVIEYALKLKK